MNKSLPLPSDILEELADKVIIAIDDLAVTTFKTAIEEMIQYHRFLLDAYASTEVAGNAFSYAQIEGDRLGSPHQDWIREYRRLFIRAANQIDQDPEFIVSLAHLPLRLMPAHAGKTSPAVVSTILDLGPLLVSRLEDWVTRRVTIENAPGETVSSRLTLTGSDKLAFTDVVLKFIGAWESLLQLVGTYYDWKESKALSNDLKWRVLSASWPFLSHHLLNTAYIAASAVWNEDSIGAERFRDSLVRWLRVFEFQLPDRYFSQYSFLLFPDFFVVDWSAIEKRLSEIEANILVTRNIDPFSLCASLLRNVHNDAILVTCAVLLRWHIEGKQFTDIALQSAIKLLRREVIDAEIGVGKEPIGFRSLFFEIIRIDLSGDLFDDKSYGSFLDGLASSVDQMSERSVVPGRIYTPSTIHGRDDLRLSFLSILLANLPTEGDDRVVSDIRELIDKESRFPQGDRSLQNIIEYFTQMTNALETGNAAFRETVEKISGTANINFSNAVERLKSIFSEASDVIRGHRTKRISALPIEQTFIDRISRAAETALLTPPARVELFRGFRIEKSKIRSEINIAEHRLTGLPKGTFTNPQMEWGWAKLDEFIISGITSGAVNIVWRGFWQRPRELITVDSDPRDKEFWVSIAKHATKIGPETLLLLHGHLRLLMEWEHFPEKRPKGLSVEKKPAVQRAPGSYIVTVEGVDVYMGGLQSGNAVLFSSASLQTIIYEPISADGRLLDLVFEPEDDPWKVSLIVRFAQLVRWDNSPILEVNFTKTAQESD